MQVGRAATPAELADLVERWGIARSAPVVVLIGGASGMDGADDARARRVLKRALIPAVAEARAAVVTGGTDAGVMRLAGEASRVAGASFPLIGVVPAELADLPEEAPRAGEAGRATGADHAGEAGRATGADHAGAPLQPDHTHLVGVPGDRWGAETPWLFAAADAVAGERGGVTLVLNGGEVALVELVESVRRGRPAIVVEGSGRAADAVAASLAHGLGGADAGSGADPDGALRRSGLVRAIRYDDEDALRAALRAALGAPSGRSRMSVGPAPTAAAPTGGGRPPAYDEEMLALIERLDATDEQRRFLRSRWLDQVGYMGARASEAKRRYYAFRLATVVGGVVVPALVSISLAGAGRFPADLDFVMRLLTFMVSALVAVTASVEGFFHFGDRWRHYRVNAELLKSEGWQYLTHTGSYRKADDAMEAFQAFAARVEMILRDDVEGFMTQVTSTGPIEKHDIFTKL